MTAGLYIHIPFCVHICGYCDFYTVSLREFSVASYIDALKDEIGLYSEHQAVKHFCFDTIYLGGGTPSLLTPTQLSGILDIAMSKFRFAADPEITLEMNPTEIELAQLKDLRSIGVNRLSLGVQSFKAAELATLDRDHSADESVGCFRSALQAGFDNINMDLIFASPGQKLKDWESSLERVVELGPSHISAYNLTYEEGTPFHRKLQKGLFKASSETLAGKMYMQALRHLRLGGYEHYEVSSFAQPGRECRHNQKYWAGNPYLGIGVSAHSYFDDLRFWNVRNTPQYCKMVKEGHFPIDNKERLSTETRIFERVLLGFRQREGLNLGLFEADFGTSVFERFPGPLTKFFGRDFGDQHLIGELTAGKRQLRSPYLQIEDGYLRLTDRGFLVSNSVCAEFS